MYLERFYRRISLDESLVETVGFNPYYPELQSGLEDRILINGRAYINLAANNYLGLAADPRVKQAAAQAVQKYGASLCSTPITTGYTDLCQVLERKLAGFLGLEDAILLPSCYQANNGLFRTIAGREDLVIIDRFAHSSLVQGIMAVGCKVRPFLHNNMEHLEEILKRSGDYRQIFVVTESVFSTDGSIAPCKELADLCRKYDALPVIDDSHGIGVLGRSGKGILEEEEISGYQGIYTASLGKAFANAGGLISGPRNLIQYLRYYCSHLVYSTALPPSVLAGIGTVLGIIESEFGLLKMKLDTYQKIIFHSLVEGGFDVRPGKAPINSIRAGSKEKTWRIAQRLYEKGIIATPFIEPAVAVGEGKVRLIAGANLREDTIREAALILRKVGSQ